MSIDPAGVSDDRIVELTGAYNFRDIGGYITKDGRSVARKKIYRSAALARLTPEDQDVFRALGIRTVCDFRATAERERRPSLLPPDVPIEIWVREYEMSAGDMLVRMTQPGASGDDSRRAMVEVYKELPYEQAEAYRALFLHVAEGTLPLLFHCSAGKDRTGIGAALLLEALGVPRASVIEDYLLTDIFFEKSVEFALNDLSRAFLRDVAQPIWEPMMKAEALYIETMFELLEARHGSIAAYLRETLGLDDGVMQKVKERLLAG